MKRTTKWEPIIMAGIGAGVAALDPSQAPITMAILCLKAFGGAAVGAYFGNHLSSRKAAKSSVAKG